MRNESGRSSKRGARARDEKALGRPFDAVVLERARAIAERYRLVMQREDGGFVARAVEMSTVFASAGSPNECEAKVREMLVAAIGTMIEMGEAPPLPAGERRVQLNIRLSEEEKLVLEEAAQRSGFRGVSEFVRFAALGMARGQGREA